MSSTAVEYGTFEATVARSAAIEKELASNPKKFRVLTGDRPTGALHIGHLFGSLRNRVRLQNLGVPIYIVIADYQVLTDRDTFENIAANVRELTLDYLAAGLDPDKDTCIFPHSHIPELNQLLLPFLTLVSMAELDRNPTVKEEIQAAGLTRINAGMYVYPVHQAADILFCKGNLVPVGKDQIPHLELSRVIARRFNDRFGRGQEVFPEPHPLLSEAPVILGLDGGQKMSKSRNNAIMLGATEDETAKLIKKAKTDSQRQITYDPANRPEVANLLLIVSLCNGQKPEKIAEEIGEQGSGKLKATVTEALNEHLRELRQRRAEFAKDPNLVSQVLKKGTARAREVAQETLAEVRKVMNMEF
ncbi:MAG: tryptophan--tRNA ligase [Candidatus Eremiobacteraeota bacterium]|nr:tryptophan--tRNA ligase [Candidatus Eremiobacteraeota bacterium]MCW5868420.1 tryptophan--tRNA ligase [Candidatus Eremiobacteraeota bacterium]